MNIEIRKLTPDLVEDYIHFFDVTPHNFEIKCYCVTWRSDASYADSENHWFPTCEERRSRAIQYVKDSSIQGYLAYHGDEVVGWCNTNEACKLCISYLSSYWLMDEYGADIKVKPVFCFAIAPDMQRKGVATQLLEQICKDATDDGFDYVEAYVNEKFTETDHEFRGPLTMYEKCGFEKFSKKDGRVVMRKALKK